jgi:hypothetical protein
VLGRDEFRRVLLRSLERPEVLGPRSQPEGGVIVSAQA